MKKTILFILSIMIIAFTNAQVKLPVIKKPITKAATGKTVPASLLSKSDPSANISFALSNKQNDVADVTITCTIKNNSTNQFVFSDTITRANVALYKTHPGGTRSLIPGRTRSFKKMASGQQIEFTYIINGWTVADFPPVFELSIKYPTKGVSNNDGNLSNNSFKLNGLDINKAILGN